MVVHSVWSLQCPCPFNAYRPAAQFSPAVLTLTRIPTPAHYPLLELGFHFINGWRYER